MTHKPKPAPEEPTTPLVEDGFVTVPEAATFLSLSRAMVYKLMYDNALVYAKFGKSRRVSRRSLLEYAARCLSSE